MPDSILFMMISINLPIRKNAKTDTFDIVVIALFIIILIDITTKHNIYSATNRCFHAKYQYFAIILSIVDVKVLLFEESKKYIIHIVIFVSFSVFHRSRFQGYSFRI